MDKQSIKRKQDQLLSINYARDIVRRMSCLMHYSCFFNCEQLSEITEARQQIKCSIEAWEKICNEQGNQG